MTIALKPNGDGSAEIQVNGVTRIAISAAGVVTLPNTPNTQLGVGQTWQNVTASRSIGTTYTNNTGKPIAVAFTPTSNTVASNTITVGGVVVMQTAYNSPTSGYTSMFAIVPDGATYVIAGNPPLNWAELR